MEVEDQFTSFTRNLYPSVEETMINNNTVLYKRKKFFLQDLRRIFNVLGYVVISMVYLRDISIFRFVIRALQQFFISNPYPTPNATTILSDQNKKAMSRFILIGIFVSNVFCLIVHLVWGVYTVSPQLAFALASDSKMSYIWGGLYSDSPVTEDKDLIARYSSSPLNLLHGGLTVQFIGDRLPYSRFELIVFDLIILLCQMVYHGLMCVLDDSEVLSTTSNSIDDNDMRIGEDGYNGNVDLVDIDIVANVRKVMSYDSKLDMTGLMPGSTLSSTNDDNVINSTGGFRLGFGDNVQNLNRTEMLEQMRLFTQAATTTQAPENNRTTSIPGGFPVDS